MSSVGASTEGPGIPARHRSDSTNHRARADGEMANDTSPIAEINHAAIGGNRDRANNDKELSDRPLLAQSDR
jgi:hypothetical protein